MSTESPPEAVTSRLGYLLKHARERLAEIATPLMEAYGVTGRELAVMLVFDLPEPLSQQEGATRLGIDRTTMVSMVDALEAKGLVRRRPAPHDRRRNLVELTTEGLATLRFGLTATAKAEEEFLAALTPRQASTFRDLLQRLVTEQPPRT